MYSIYILECADGSLYTGITTDVARRLVEHRAGMGGHYTRAKSARNVLYTEPHPNRSTASKREAEIKSWPRAKKLALIRSENSTPSRDLFRSKVRSSDRSRAVVGWGYGTIHSQGDKNGSAEPLIGRSDTQ